MINLKKLMISISRISLAVFLVFVSTFGTGSFNVSAVSEPGSVFLDKTHADLGEGLYEITLQVRGIPAATPNDIVLVIDTSGSMGSAGRLTAAKNAAKGFIDLIIDLNDGHRIAVVSFANYPGVAHGFSSNKATLKASIDALSANGGTHLEGGIYEATKLLQNNGAAGSNKSIVVLGDGIPTFGYDFDVVYTGPVTLENDTWIIFPICRASVSQADQDNDANFTGRFGFDYNVQVGEGNSVFFDKEFEVSGVCPNGRTGTFDFDKQFDLRDSVDYLADQAKALGYSIYSIGLSVDATGADVLENIQNSGYYDANIGNLDDVYDDIALQVVAAGRDALVLDKIGDDFEFVSLSPGYEGDATYNNATRILRWEIGNIGNEVIDLKYIVSINPGLPKGDYPTNEYADLTYTDIHDSKIEREFPVPVVVLPNQPPTASNDSFTVSEGGAHSDVVAGSDPESDPLVYTLVMGPANGTLVFGANGSYTYTHDHSEAISDSFTFKVNDGEFDSNIATVTITVTPVNEVPVVMDDAFTVDEGGVHNDEVEGSDPDGDELDFILVDEPDHGTLVFNIDGTYTYTHDGSETISDSFTFKANDGGFDSNIGTVTITVRPVNDPPVANDDTFTVAEGGVWNDEVMGSDPENDELDFLLVVGPVNGTLVFNLDGTYTYTHNGSETTSDSFTFKVNDGLLDSNVATVTITVTPVNDPPVADDDSFVVNEGAAHSDQVTGSDPEGDELDFFLVVGPTNGTLVFNIDGTYTYTHNGSETTSDSFTFKANDGALDSNIATVTIRVNPVNDPPIADNDAFEVDQGEAHSDTATGFDPEGMQLEFILVSGPTHGTIVFNADGTFTYTHDNSENYEDVFTFKVNDGEFDSNVANVTILINATLPDDNAAPEANDSEFDVDQGETHNGLVTGSDPDGDEITFILVNGPEFGTLVFNPDGTYTYTHNDSTNYEDSFTFKVFDGDVESEVANVTILINATLPDTSDNNLGLLGYGALLMGLVLWFVSKKKESYK